MRFSNLRVLDFSKTAWLESSLFKSSQILLSKVLQYCYDWNYDLKSYCWRLNKADIQLVGGVCCRLPPTFNQLMMTQDWLSRGNPPNVCRQLCHITLFPTLTEEISSPLINSYRFFPQGLRKSCGKTSCPKFFIILL